MMPDMTKETPMISLADQKRRIEQGALTPDAALAESLAAIDKHEPEIKAFVVRAKNPKARAEGASRLSFGRTSPSPRDTPERLPQAGPAERRPRRTRPPATHTVPLRGAKP